MLYNLILCSFFVLLATLIVAGCKKKDIWPKETYEMLNKRAIKISDSQITIKRFRFEESLNKHVAVYTNQVMDLSQCNDCGHPIIAF